MSLGVAASLVRHIERERDVRVAVLKRRAAVALREYKHSRVGSNPSVTLAEARQIIKNWRGVPGGIGPNDKILMQGGQLFVRKPGRKPRALCRAARYSGPARSTRIRRH